MLEMNGLDFGEEYGVTIFMTVYRCFAAIIAFFFLTLYGHLYLTTSCHIDKTISHKKFMFMNENDKMIFQSRFKVCMCH